MLGLAKVYYIDFDKPFSLDTEDQLMNLHWLAHSHECILKCAMSFEAVMCKGLQQCITLFRIWLIHYIYIETGIIWALEVSVVQICTILRFISCQSCWEVLLTFPILSIQPNTLTQSRLMILTVLTKLQIEKNNWTILMPNFSNSFYHFRVGKS